MADPQAGTDYELLVRDLVSQLPIYAEVTTTRLDHDVQVLGRATSNQIDVLWDFTDAAGQDHRVVFEARSYTRAIDQGKLHAFRSVVDDIQNQIRPVTGAMVTTEGYQRGGKKIADTYGLLVLELREPEAKDLKNRLVKITVEVVPQFVAISEVVFRAIDVYDNSMTETRQAVEHMALVPRAGSPGVRQPLGTVLTTGELGELGKPRPAHRVVREFDPPLELWVGNTRTALLQGVEATVGESTGRPATVTVGGLDTLAYMLRDALSDARVWFGTDGRVWETD